MGPVPFSLSAEVGLAFICGRRQELTFYDQVFPLENRVVGMSFAVFLNFLGAGILTLVVPPLTVSIKHKIGDFKVLVAWQSLFGCPIKMLISNHRMSSTQRYCPFSQVRNRLV